MSLSPGKKPKSRDRSSHPDISYPELSGPQSQVVTGESKKKKRKFANLNVLYTGSSDEEVTPKRTKKEQHSETESVPPAPKRRKNGDIIFEEQTEQGMSRKKKKGKEESHWEAEDSRADENIKKSHKTKKSESGHRDQESPDSKSAELDSKSRKEKKEKKDGGERPSDNRLVEESSTADGQSANEKKKTKRKDGEEESQSQHGFSKRKHQGGFETTENVTESEDQAEDNQELQISETQHSRKKKKKRKDDGGLTEDGFSEECFSQQKCPNGSETLEQAEKPSKKKKSKVVLHEEVDGIAVDASSSLVGLHSEEPSCRDLIDIEDKPCRKKTKKSKKDFEDHPMEGLMEESVTSNTVNAVKKKKQKYGGGLRDDGFSSQRNYSDDQEQVAKSTDQAEKPTKKKKKEESHREDDDIAVDDEASFVGLHVEEALCREVSDSEDRPGRKKKKKKSKKDFEDHSMESLIEESMATNTVDAIKKKKQKYGGGLQEDGFTEGFISPRKSSHDPEPVDESTDQAEKPTKKKKKKRKDESHREVDDTAEDNEASCIALHHDIPEKIKKATKPKSLVLPEELLYSEPVSIINKSSVKKKSKKDRLVGDGLVEESTLSEKMIKWEDSGDEGQRQHEEEGESVDQAEAHGKKKKKHKKDRGDAHQEADLTVSSSGGLHREEHSCGEFAGTEDRASRKEKKKSKKHHRDGLLEEGLVEELLTPDVQHTSEKKAKRKDGGHQSHRHQGFTEKVSSTKRKQQDGSEETEQADENEEMAEKPAKKKKKRRRELPHEADDAAADEASSTVGLRGEEPSQSEFPATEDTLRRRKKEKSTNQHQERLLENDLVEDTEQSHRPPTPSSSDVDQNPATRDERLTAQNEEQEWPAALKANMGKRRGRTRVPFALRPQDAALIHEFVPRIKDEETLQYICRHELERVKAAKREGIVFRSGQFTVDEDEQIRKNVLDFASRFGIESPEMLLHPYLFPEFKTTMYKLKTKYRFRTRLAEGLHRFSFHVYFRAVKLFAQVTTKGRFSNEEVAQLKMYREVFGKNWQAIACALNREYDSIRMKVTQLHDGNRGVWSTEETNCLITAIKEIILDSLRKENNGEEPVTVPKRKLDTGIPWFIVERKVETRVWTSCRVRWFNLLMMRMNNYINPFGKTLKIKAYIRIIQWLYDKNVKEYGDVKWHELSDYIGNVPVNYIQTKFHGLKSNIAGWRDMRLYEIVKELYNDMLPKLEQQLAAAEEIAIEPETKDEFLISEIFKEYLECGEKFED